MKKFGLAYYLDLPFGARWFWASKLKNIIESTWGVLFASAVPPAQGPAWSAASVAATSQSYLSGWKTAGVCPLHLPLPYLLAPPPPPTWRPFWPLQSTRPTWTPSPASWPLPDWVTRTRAITPAWPQTRLAETDIRLHSLSEVPLTATSRFRGPVYY